MTETSALSAALVAALADVAVITKGRTADAGSYSYDYADLGDTVREIQPRLAQHGIRVLTPVHGFEDRLACTVILVHESGEELRFDPLPFPYGRDAQATGSMMTYYRRYALTAALGLGTADDDGAGAHTYQPPQEDPAVPGLRSSIEGAISKLDDEQKAALKDWFREQNLPAVRRMNAAQCVQVLDHLMALPEPAVGVTPDEEGEGRSVGADDPVTPTPEPEGDNR